MIMEVTPKIQNMVKKFPSPPNINGNAYKVPPENRPITLSKILA